MSTNELDFTKRSEASILAPGVRLTFAAARDAPAAVDSHDSSPDEIQVAQAGEFRGSAPNFLDPLMAKVTDLPHEMASRASHGLEEIRILFGDDEKSTEKACVKIDRENVLRDSLHDHGDRNVVTDRLRDFLGIAFDVGLQQITLVDIGREFELQHLNLLNVVRPSALNQRRVILELFRKSKLENRGRRVRSPEALVLARERERFHGQVHDRAFRSSLVVEISRRCDFSICSIVGIFPTEN